MKKYGVLIVSLIALLVFPIGVKADDCEFEKSITLNLDLSSSDTLTVLAKAGKLTITGQANSDEAVIQGKACASSEEWLAESGIETVEGDTSKIEVVLPNTDKGWSFTGNKYAYIDLELQVPDSITLDVVDSSGSMTIEGVGSLSIKDSSGSMTIEDINGSISLKDSSGSITFDGVDGDITILSDSSGSIKGKDITGSVLVKKDSSGSISFKDVGQDFIVEQDSSGSIIADNIGGDFRVLKDGSGGIRSSNVKGEVSIPAVD